jgi:hypothetical protein
MAAYPFRQMTTRQLVKLLQDDRELNQSPPEQSDSSDPIPQIHQSMRTQPTPSNPAKMSTESR